MFDFLSKRRIKGEGFTVTLGARGRLTYEADGCCFLINALEGNGYGIVLEEMADSDLGLQSKSLDVRRSIALNVKHALATRGITVDVYEDHRVVSC
jgi:hypothetical protein